MTRAPRHNQDRAQSTRDAVALLGAPQTDHDERIVRATKDCAGPADGAAAGCIGDTSWLRKFAHMAVAHQHLVCADSLDVLRAMPSRTVDLVLTSPPYNLDIKYASYEDNRNIDDYLQWVSSWLSEVRRILKNDGSFFLNLAGSSTKPLIPHQVLMEAVKCGFVLQNDITWVKSVYIPSAVHANDRDALKPGHTFGHLKPVNGNCLCAPGSTILPSGFAWPATCVGAAIAVSHATQGTTSNLNRFGLMVERQ